MDREVQSSQALASSGQREATGQVLSAQFQAIKDPLSSVNPQEVRYFRTKLAHLRLENLRKEQKLQGLKDVFHSMRVTSAPVSPKRTISAITDLKTQIKEVQDRTEAEIQTQDSIALQRNTLWQGLVWSRQAVAKEREREVREVHRRVTRKHVNVQIARFQADQQAAFAVNQLNLVKISLEEGGLQYRSAVLEQREVLARTEQQAELATQHISRLDREVKARKHSENEAIRLLSAAVEQDQSRKSQALACELRLQQLRRTLGRIGE